MNKKLCKVPKGLTFVAANENADTLSCDKTSRREQ